MQSVTLKGVWLQFDDDERSETPIADRIREAMDIINRVLVDNDSSVMGAQIFDSDGSIEANNFEVDPIDLE